MNNIPSVIEFNGLNYSYGRAEALHGLTLRVERGRCYGLFGRNGAGKTTAMKCLLNLLRPKPGMVKVFGIDPARDDVAIKSRLAYVPDFVAFYPWMTVQGSLDYVASFRHRWNSALERNLLERFRLDPRKLTSALSKGQRTQLALVGALAAEPELLVLDEPTSGLDPIVRREFIETVIGSFQDADPGNRTVFISTHLIGEFEGLIDEFTVLNDGRQVLTMNADSARESYGRIRARFPTAAPETSFPGALSTRRDGRNLEVVVNGRRSDVLAHLRTLSPEEVTTESLTLEEIVVATLK